MLKYKRCHIDFSWWRHQMETLSALLAICAGNSPVPGEFPAQRPVTRSIDVFFELRLNKQLNKQPWGSWFETPQWSLWRHCNVYPCPYIMTVGPDLSQDLWHITIHDDVIKWKHFPRYWSFVRGIRRSPVNSPHKSQWRGALIFSLICVWTNDWVKNR